MEGWLFRNLKLTVEKLFFWSQRRVAQQRRIFSLIICFVNTDTTPESSVLRNNSVAKCCNTAKFCFVCIQEHKNLREIFIIQQQPLFFYRSLMSELDRQAAVIFFAAENVSDKCKSCPRIDRGPLRCAGKSYSHDKVPDILEKLYILHNTCWSDHER